jgi:hypothetical protein
MRRLAALVLVLLAGCGGDAPSAVVPADATIYVGVSEAEVDRIVRGISRDSEPDVEPWLGERAA